MLVAASPCALAISVPLTVVAAIGAASRHGALVKGGAALEELGRIRAVALDKTGTLTRNRPEVVDVVAAPAHDRAEVLATAAALEARSEHPLARAILGRTPVAGRRRRRRDRRPRARADRSRDGAQLRLGKPAGSTPASADDVERLQASGATVVLVERDGALLGAIAVRDELRPEAPEAVRRLRGLGIDVAMLTGDNPRTADGPGRARPASTTVHAELLPEDKARLLAAASRRPAGSPWSATASTTPPRWPPPTSASPWAPWAPTSPSRPPTSR